jgi:tRNA modification GTPase
LTDAPIAALASGHGPAAVALLRLSGRGCHELLAKCLRIQAKAWPAQALRRAQVFDPATGEVIDEVLATRFVAPRSYTGEDAAELHCHGGPYVVRRVLAVLFAGGFRAAEPGEFTRRAFLNGKLDLTAAEGIRELVSAESHQQWLAARQLATGRLKETIETLRRDLLEAMAYLEAQIDFPDEGDTAKVDREQVRERVARVEAGIARLVASYDSGRVAARGLAVALFGEPNAGKSSLMNALLGRERAIVTDIAGTTRDWLEEPCLVDGRLVRLIDMAGMREAQDPVERIGVAAALKLAREADIVLFLAPADGGPDAPGKVAQWVAELAPRRHVVVLTKADLGRPAWADPTWPEISCRTGSGLDALRMQLAAMVDAHVGSLREDTFVTAARHVDALRQAQASLEAFAREDAEGAFEEMLAFELQNAARALRAIVGEVGNDDVLDTIFREFCVGK